MTLQEILKSQGLSDEQIETVTGEMKQNKIFTAGEENLDIRYGDLSKKHKEATTLIEQLKKDNANNQGLQDKVTEYESKIKELETERDALKVDFALKSALEKSKVQDVDYICYKIKSQGTELKLDDNGSIKGIDDIITSVKTQYPNQFPSADNNNDGKKIDPNKLGKGDDKGDPEPTSLADAIKMSYENKN